MKTTVSFGVETLTPENFAANASLYAIMDPFPSTSFIVSRWLFTHYEGVLNADFISLYCYTIQSAYSIEAFKSAQWVTDFFAWLKPQTDATVDTLKALSNG